MTSAQLSRISGLGLLIGAIAFVVHVVLRSLIFSDGFRRVEHCLFCIEWLKYA
jgi:hypothetical protein